MMELHSIVSGNALATTSATGLNPDGGLYSPVIFRQSNRDSCLVWVRRVRDLPMSIEALTLYEHQAMIKTQGNYRQQPPG
jgi:hypothetical protein